MSLISRFRSKKIYTKMGLISTKSATCCICDNQDTLRHCIVSENGLDTSYFNDRPQIHCPICPVIVCTGYCMEMHAVDNHPDVCSICRSAPRSNGVACGKACCKVRLVYYKYFDHRYLLPRCNYCGIYASKCNAKVYYLPNSGSTTFMGTDSITVRPHKQHHPTVYPTNLYIGESRCGFISVVGELMGRNKVSISRHYTSELGQPHLLCNDCYQDNQGKRTLVYPTIKRSGLREYLQAILRGKTTTNLRYYPYCLEPVSKRRRARFAITQTDTCLRRNVPGSVFIVSLIYLIQANTLHLKFIDNIMSLCDSTHLGVIPIPSGMGSNEVTELQQIVILYKDNVNYVELMRQLKLHRDEVFIHVNRWLPVPGLPNVVLGYINHMCHIYTWLQRISS